MRSIKSLSRHIRITDFQHDFGHILLSKRLNKRLQKLSSKAFALPFGSNPNRLQFRIGNY